MHISYHCVGSMLQKSQQGIQKSCLPEFSILLTLNLPLYELVVFVDMDTYILTENRNFKTFLKENYAIALDSCYLFTKKLFEHDNDSAYGVS